MTHHSRRIVASSVVALVLLAVAVLVTVSTVQLLLGAVPLVPFAALGTALAGLTTASPAVVATAVAVAVIGLLLLLTGLTPGAAVVLPLAHSDGQPVTGAGRSDLERAMAASAREVSGVDGVAVRYRRSTVTASVTALAGSAELTEQVRTALAARLDDLAPARRPRIRVTTRTTTGHTSGSRS